MSTNREVFLAQCKRRFGTCNPERMRLEHWEWMVRYADGPQGVRKGLGLESNSHYCHSGEGCEIPGPDWCFRRFGMSRTDMGDGRTVCVGGEHEDYYDPDFCIYNDVIVLRPGYGRAEFTIDSGDVEIYGYPADVFPPTDFHSATLVGDLLIIIGRLGYGGGRVLGSTPVFSLDTNSYRVAELVCGGDCPGWIFDHHASFDPVTNAITARGGKALRPDVEQTLPFRAVHRLRLGDMRWELVSDTDEFRMFLIEAVRTGVGFREPVLDDLSPISVPHAWLPPEGEENDVIKLDVSGVRFTFLNMHSSFRVMVEGTLPRVLLDKVLDEIVENLNRGSAVWEFYEVNPNCEW